MTDYQNAPILLTDSQLASIKAFADPNSSRRAYPLAVRRMRKVN